MTSSRRLEQRLREDLAFRYLAAGAAPDHWTLNAFRRRHAKGLNDLFTQVVELARASGLGRLGHVAIDSTRIAANASRNRIDTEQALRDARARIRRDVRRWQQQCDADDPNEGAGNEVDRTVMERLEQQGIPERLERLRKSGLKKMSRSDPDSHFLRERGGFTLGYTATLAVSEDHLIVAQQLGQAATDNELLVPMVDLLEQQCRERPQRVSIRVVLAGVFMLILNPICRRLPAFRNHPSTNNPLRASPNPSNSSSAAASPNSSASPHVPTSPNPAKKIVIPSEARDLLPSSTSQAPRITSHAQRPTPHDLWTFLYLGFLGVTVNQVCFTIGLRFTSVTHSAIIVGMGPIYALVLAVLLRLESATLRKVLGMTISVFGVILLATARDSAQHAPTLLGDFLTFIGSLGFALYAVLGKRVASRYDPLTMTTYNFFFGALFVLPIAIHRSIVFGPQWLALPWTGWAAVIYMALFSSSLAYLFYFWLLRYLEVTQLAAYNYLLPVSASLLGILLLNERGSWPDLVGGALALAGVYFVESTRTP